MFGTKAKNLFTSQNFHVHKILNTKYICLQIMFFANIDFVEPLDKSERENLSDFEYTPEIYPLKINHK